MKNLYQILEMMKARPGMYLGEKSISLLRSYLSGYDHALSELNIASGETPPFGLFHQWTANYFGYGLTSCGWNTILLNENQGNQAQALDQFYVLLEEFKKVRPTWIGQVHILKENVDFYHANGKNNRNVLYFSEEGVERVRQIPEQIYVVEFSDNLGCWNYRIKDEKLLGVDWRMESRTKAMEQIEKEFGTQLMLVEIVEPQVQSTLETIARYPYFRYI